MEIFTHLIAGWLAGVVSVFAWTTISVFMDHRRAATQRVAVAKAREKHLRLTYPPRDNN